MPPTVLRADFLIATTIMLMIASPAAASSTRFAIAAGPLSEAIMRFGEQSGLTIGIADPRLGQRHSPGITGRFTNEEALQRLLIGTGATFTFINARTMRIIALPLRPAPLPPPASSAPAVDAPAPDIVVTASKQGTALDHYPGSVDIVMLDPEKNARSASRGTSAILARLPMVASTNLGPGRDKLFIRGVADSSFNGPTQATVGQYLGDVRLTYNAPDPDLNLYDMDHVEILAGPQGTLYGIGALGGIIRLVPNMPNASETAASFAAGIGTTQDGGVSHDVAGMLNLPIVSDTLAVRATGYSAIDAGYIDDPLRQLQDINRTVTYGGRVGLRYQPDSTWTIDVGGVLQNIESRDGQYTLRGEPDLTRSTRIAQPFDNDYRLAHVRVEKRWSDMQLVSSTSIVQHELTSVYDASPSLAGPTRYFDETIDISLISHETHLSGRRRGTDDWVVGISALHDIERQRRRLGDPADPETITGVRNEVSEVALFGQYTMPITHRLSATAGGRLTYSSADGQALDNILPEKLEPRRHMTWASPSLALSWRPRDKVLLFLHYQEGARAGGLAVGPTSSPLSVQRFESDTLGMIESGFRLGQPGRDRIAASATISYARWSNIQADLVDVTGLPFTTNIGSGQIFALDVQMSWKLTPALQMELSAYFNDSALKKPAPAFIAADERELPNVAKAGGRAALSYHRSITHRIDLTIDGSLRYVGVSQLGIGPPLDVSQGRYLESDLGGRIDFGRFGLSVDVTNLGNVRGNRFAFGNPFGLAARNQITPLRPRSIRIGVDATF